MEKVIIENENGENQLELFLSNEEIKPFLDKAYSQAQKNLKIPGFRPGHIPINLIKNMYGKAIEADTNIEIVNDYFPRIATEENLILLGNPNLLDIQKTDEGIKYIIGYQTIPDFKIKDYKENLTVYEPVHIVTNEEIENRLDEMAYTLAERQSQDVIESYSYSVKFNITTQHHHEDEEEGNENESDEHTETNSDEIYLNAPGMDQEFKDAFLNRKKGEKFVYSPSNDPHHTFEIEITDITQIIPPAIDDEFARRVSQNKYDTLEELRNNIELELQDSWDDEAQNEMYDQLRERLIQDNWDLVVPEQLMEYAKQDFLKAIKKRYNIPETETSIDSKLLEYAGDAPKKIALWELLKSKLYKLESVEIEDSDIEVFIEKQKRYFQNLSTDAAMDLVKKNVELMERIKEQKLFEILLGYATTEEISFEDWAAKKEIQTQAQTMQNNTVESDATSVEASPDEEINDLQNDEERSED
jgi:trigger factor